MSTNTLVKKCIEIQNSISKARSLKNFYWDQFSSFGGYDNHKQVEEYDEVITALEAQLLDVASEYDILKNKISSNGNIHYAITIGSSEKTNITPCLHLWERFISSADGKDFLTQSAYFEKGDNGYIHIHAIVEKSKGWSMSIPKLRERYGKLKGKQHNFDIKRIKGLEIPKWKNYIKKDATQTWNISSNNSLKNNDSL